MCNTAAMNSRSARLTSVRRLPSALRPCPASAWYAFSICSGHPAADIVWITVAIEGLLSAVDIKIHGVHALQFDDETIDLSAFRRFELAAAVNRLRGVAAREDRA